MCRHNHSTDFHSRPLTSHSLILRGELVPVVTMHLLSQNIFSIYEYVQFMYNIYVLLIFLQLLNFFSFLKRKDNIIHSHHHRLQKKSFVLIILCIGRKTRSLLFSSLCRCFFLLFFLYKNNMKTMTEVIKAVEDSVTVSVGLISDWYSSRSRALYLRIRPTLASNSRNWKFNGKGRNKLEEQYHCCGQLVH